MPRLCVYVLAVALAVASFSEASWQSRSQLQDVLAGPGTNRGQPDSASHHHRRQLGPQGPPHFIEDLSKKQGPWMEEEEAAYGWMDFGRRSAEEEDRRP